MDPSRPERILRQHVRTDQLFGVGMVPLGAQPPAGDPQPPEPSHELTAPAGPAPQAMHEPAPAEASGGGGLAPMGAQMSRDQRQAELDRIELEEVRGCTKCGLCQGRTQTVFGEGDPEAPIMFIGEGPGQREDELGRPFVGRAGELLDRMIQAMGYERQQLYIANVVKCRPPNNRTPTAVEVRTCWDYLRRQIEIIVPRVIVTVGGPATKMVLDVSTGITKLRGTWHQYQAVDPPIPVMPTFHPAYLLRAYTRENREKVWYDLQKVISRVS
jgi:DNA polymerase